MGNTVFCSISTDDNNDEIFSLVKGEGQITFDLDKLLPKPAIFGKIKARGYRDILAMAHVDETCMADKEASFESIIKVSRNRYNCEDMDAVTDVLLKKWVEEIYNRYDKNGHLIEGKQAIKADYCDEAYIFPATLADVMADAANIYQAFLETGHLWESEWRYENLGVGYQPRFGEKEEGYIKFECNNSAPVKAFILFAKMVKLNGDAEYFEENEDFWGKLIFKNGELVEHRESLKEDFEDFFGEPSDEDE